MGKPIIATDNTKGNTKKKKRTLKNQHAENKINNSSRKNKKSKQTTTTTIQQNDAAQRSRAKCSVSSNRRLATLSFQAISRFYTCHSAISRIVFDIVVVVRFFLHHTSSNFRCSYFLSLSASLVAHFVVCIVKLYCCCCGFFSLALLCFCFSLVAAIFVA